MGLLTDAADQAKAILEDTDGFGLTATVTNPLGVSASVTGLPSDIGQSLDPETGMVVSKRLVSLALPMAALDAAFETRPVGVSGHDEEPWLVRFQAPGMKTAQDFKVEDTLPDQTLGILVCFLGVYET